MPDISARGKKRERIYKIILPVFIAVYSVIIAGLSFTAIPAYILGSLASFIVIFFALRWGLSGGIISAVLAAAIIINIMLLGNYDVKFFIPGIFAYFLAGAGIGITIDIFNKQRDEINKNRKKYQTIVENTNDALYIMDLRGNIFDVNETACRMLGYEKHELIGSGVMKIISPEDMEHLHGWMVELINKGSVQFENRHVRKDGSEINVESSVVLISGEGDGIMQSFVRDITERKQAEKELLRSHRLLTVLNSIDAFIYVADMETHEILFVNEYGKKTWGEVNGQKCWQYIRKRHDEGPCDFCTNEKLLNEEGNPLGVYEWEHYNDEDSRWYLCRDRAIQWIDGRMVKVHIRSDITERKFGENLLIQSHRRLFTVLNSIDATIYVTDMENHDVLFVNNTAKNRWGDITGSKCWKTIQKNKGGPCSSCIHDKLKDAGGNIAGVNKWDYYNPKNNRWYEHRDSAFNWVDNRPACLSIITDITERKKNEEERYRIKLYSAIEEEKMNLARDLHDEVGMALTVVKLELQMLDKKYSCLDHNFKKRLEKSLDIIENSQQRVRSKTAFLRPPALDELGLITVLQNMMEEISDQANLNINLDTTAAVTNFPVEVETVLYRCVQEAITNVVRHASAAAVDINLSWNNSEVSVKIKDDGTGFNVDEDSTSGNKMGIRGMKERVFLLRGHISIHSSPGAGTEIIIKIPLEAKGDGKNEDFIG